jgi:hypothetical protein
VHVGSVKESQGCHQISAIVRRDRLLNPENQTTKAPIHEEVKEQWTLSWCLCALVQRFVNTVAYSSKHARSGRGGFHTRPKPDRAGINPAPYWAFVCVSIRHVFRKWTTWWFIPYHTLWTSTVSCHPERRDSSASITRSCSVSVIWE